MTYLLLFLALSSNAVANIFMKLGSEQFAAGLKLLFTKPMVFFSNGYFFAGLFFFGIALFLYAQVLARMSLSIAYPIMTTLGFVIVVGFSVLFLKEQLMWWQWLGMVLVLAGVILLSWEGGGVA
jgi:multidrug transporter EmrE-like cation transporter